MEQHNREVEEAVQTVAQRLREEEERKGARGKEAVDHLQQAAYLVDSYDCEAFQGRVRCKHRAEQDQIMRSIIIPFVEAVATGGFDPRNEKVYQWCFNAVRANS